MKLKNIIPKSLLGRFLLIIIIPTVIAQAIAVLVFYERHWDNVSVHMARSVAGEISVIIKTKELLTDHEFEDFMKKFEPNLDLRVRLIRNKLLPVNSDNSSDLRILAKELSSRINNKFIFTLINDKSDVKISIKLGNDLLEVITNKKRLVTPTTYIFIMWMTGATSILLILSIIFSRNQIRSITRLADAAEKFGKGQDISGFKSGGAIEVKKAARAFLRMKERIERQIMQRTQMLAGVSHDLRTPLTRLKLQFAMLEQTEEVDEMNKDVNEMERMIEGYLNFARSGDIEVSEEIDLVELCNDLVKKYQHVIDIEFITNKPNIVMFIKKLSFKRALANLLDNASKYGNKAKFTIFKRHKEVEIIIEDNGDGIDEDKKELVFKPFYRIENQKNSETSGVGLGLSITKDIILLHGGKISLGRSNLSGLKVTISLPL